MTKNKKLRSLIIYVGILLVTAGTVSAFTDLNPNPKPTTDWTQYYWFTNSGTYLRQNIVDDEIDLTGYDEFSSAPFTVQERGYAPGACYPGNPPIPHFWYLPSKRLYSHP
jgi:hypothetical protein